VVHPVPQRRADEGAGITATDCRAPTGDQAIKLAISFVLLALGAFPASPARAQEDEALVSNTPWVLDYDTDSCALRRAFGEGEKRAYLELRRFGPGTDLQAVVATNWMRAENPATFKYRFNNQTEWSDVTRAPTLTMVDDFKGAIFTAGLIELPGYSKLKNLKDRQAFLAGIDLPALEREASAKADTLFVRGAFRRQLVLKLGSLDKTMAALNTCVDELMTHWGIDVEAHKSLTRKADAINLDEVPRMMSYPPAMLSKNMPGVVNFRLDVDETGKITDCHIQMPLSDPVFEKSSCADLQHALEFEPALDKDGKPIASYWINKVVFQIGY
jgi:hypothetical protein